jgi:hypothetical protein
VRLHRRWRIRRDATSNDLTGIRKQLAVLPIVMQALSLNLEQSGFHSRGAAQPPQNARQSQHELALDNGLNVALAVHAPGWSRSWKKHGYL